MKEPLMTVPATKYPNLYRLTPALDVARRNGFALGSFSPRYTAMIRPILRAAQRLASPAIVQISQREMARYGITPKQFVAAFHAGLEAERVTVPVVLHLDHTFEIGVLESAVEAGFTSVMMDASAKPLAENIATVAEAAALAHSRGASIEAELGKIGTTDFVETEKDEEFYTVPAEASEFVAKTGVDALAVSVGTAHGAYTVRQPKIDYERLQAIRAATDVHLVLHGGSGVPEEMVKRAIALPGGGISKVNIATDLEESLLKALGRKERMSDAECSALEPTLRQRGEAAVEATVAAKIERFLLSAGRAALYASA